MRATRPTARTTLTVFEFFLGPTDPTFAGGRSLGVLDPTDELVPSEWRDVLPRRERGVVRDQRVTQITWEIVDDPTRHTLHGDTLLADGSAVCRSPGAGSTAHRVNGNTPLIAHSDGGLTAGKALFDGVQVTNVVFDAGRGDSGSPLGRHSAYFDDGTAIDNLVAISTGGTPTPSHATPVERRLEDTVDDEGVRIVSFALPVGDASVIVTLSRADGAAATLTTDTSCVG